MKEIWKDIPGYEGCYQVSNLGKVKSLPRFGRTKGKIMKNFVQGNDYYGVKFSVDGYVKQYPVHVLVALAFIGPRPKDYAIHHKNHNIYDNTERNITYCTASQNVLFSLLEGNRKSKFNEQEVLDIRESLETGEVLAKKYNVSVNHINCIKRRKCYKYI